MTDPGPPAASRPTLEGTEWSVSLPGQVLSIIEVPLLLLLAYGFVVELGSTSYAVQPAIYPPTTPTVVTDSVPGYLAAWLIVATVAVLLALVLIGAALLQRLPARKIRRLTVANICTAAAAGLGVTGATFLHAVWTWNTTPQSSFAPLGSAPGPTASTVVSQLLLSLAAGAGAALLPCLVVFIMYRTQRIAADR